MFLYIVKPGKIPFAHFLPTEINLFLHMRRSLRNSFIFLFVFCLSNPIVIAADESFYPADAQRGKKVATVCLTCHGVPEMLSGTTPSFRVPLLAGQRGEVIFQALQDYQSGKRKSAVMQPMVAALSLQDMRDLGAYLSASGPYVPATHDEGSWAHEKVHRDCTICHGESGMGVTAGVPVLTGQYEDYLIYALKSYQNGARADNSMGPIAKKLSDDDIAKLAKYFSNQAHLKVSQ